MEDISAFFRFLFILFILILVTRSGKKKKKANDFQKTAQRLEAEKATIHRTSASAKPSQPPRKSAAESARVFNGEVKKAPEPARTGSTAAASRTGSMDFASTEGFDFDGHVHKNSPGIETGSMAYESSEGSDHPGHDHGGDLHQTATAAEAPNSALKNELVRAFILQEVLKRPEERGNTGL